MNFGESYISRIDSLFHRYTQLVDENVIVTSIEPADKQSLVLNMRYTPFSYTKNGYNQLLNMDDELPETYFELLQELTNLYDNGGRTMEMVIASVEEAVDAEYEALQAQSWYYDWMILQDLNSDTLATDFVEYALMDPMRKNRVAVYHDLYKDNFYTFGLGYRLGAKQMYKTISKILGDEHLPPEINIRAVDERLSNQITGVYTDHYEVERVRIYKDEGEQLVMTLIGNTRNILDLYQVSENKLVALGNQGLFVYETISFEEDGSLILGGIDRHSRQLIRKD